jgi:hypothetical protein
MRFSLYLPATLAVLSLAIAACTADPESDAGQQEAGGQSDVRIQQLDESEDDQPSAGDQQVSARSESLVQLGALSLRWEVQPVGEGIKPAFAIDSSGVAHVAFLTEAEHGGLFYAQNGAGHFETETVAEGYFYGPIDLALDPRGLPLIAYHDHQALGFDPQLGDEVVAILGDGGWELITVSDDGHDGWDNSIVVDEQGFWHTAAVDPSQFGGQDGVEYATNSSGAISVETTGSGPIRYEFATSIALDANGSPGIAYYNDRDQQLEYAALGQDGWTIQVVDSEGDAGRYASLLFDLEGNPHIAYFTAASRSAGTVNHAWRDDSGWQVELVGELDNIAMGAIGARKITALAIDESGGLHLAYTDRDRMVYAQRTVDGWGGQEVFSAGDRKLGQLIELELDSSGAPHLIWYEVVSQSPFAGAVFYASGN